jgi:hypothetical protein
VEERKAHGRHYSININVSINIQQIIRPAVKMGFTKAVLASSLLLLGQAAALDPIVMKVSSHSRRVSDLCAGALRRVTLPI